MNCIRLTYSLQMINDTKCVDKKYLGNNSDLYNNTPFQIFKKVVQTLTDVGLMVILNNHISDSKWCCGQND